MTTQVRIEIAQEHKAVEVMRSDGLYPKVIRKQGEVVMEYVHGGQHLMIRELSDAELAASEADRKVAALERLQGREDIDSESKQAIQAGIAAIKKGHGRE